MAVQTSKETLKEYGRGIIGGLLISLPLVYTMEVWWTGFTAPPSYLLSCVVVTYLLLLGYNRYAGMRKDSSFREICRESVEELGLGFIVSFLFLLLLSRIDFGMSMDEIAGKVIVETMIVAIGISVGTAQMGGGGASGSDGESKDSKNNSEEGSREGSKSREDSNSNGKSGGAGEDSKDKDSPDFKKLVLSICGAVLFASSVAPTEEILMIAVGVNNIELLIMVFVSLLLGGVIVYFSEFKGAPEEKPGVHKMILELAVMYLVALLVSFAFLWFFGRVQDYSLYIVVAQMVVLAIPGAIGASAGRFLIGGGNE